MSPDYLCPDSSLEYGSYRWLQEVVRPPRARSPKFNPDLKFFTNTERNLKVEYYNIFEGAVVTIISFTLNLDKKTIEVLGLDRTTISEGNGGLDWEKLCQKVKNFFPLKFS